MILDIITNTNPNFPAGINDSWPTFVERHPSVRVQLLRMTGYRYGLAEACRKSSTVNTNPILENFESRFT